jgi:hypothetical protein
MVVAQLGLELIELIMILRTRRLHVTASGDTLNQKPLKIIHTNMYWGCNDARMLR